MRSRGTATSQLIWGRDPLQRIGRRCPPDPRRRPEAAYRLEVLACPGLVLGVSGHLLQGRVYGGIERQVHALVHVSSSTSGSLPPGPVAGHLVIGGGIHQPDVALAGPGEPPALHEGVLPVEALVVFQQEG